MNIVGHIAIGVTGYAITKEPLWLVGSVIPDIALIPNEINNLIHKKRFDKWDVKFKFLYDLTHSLFIPAILFFVSPILSLAYLLHLIIDIPFHTSSFRWKPFLINRYKTKKKALLLSGGMDSVACAFMEKDFDCIYFNYGQIYHEKEFPFAIEMAKKLGKELIVHERPWKTDIENRNFYLIAECKKLGYDEVIVGSRNIFPFTDPYGDSNWFNMKLYQYLMGIYINMPITGCLKFQVKAKLQGYTGFFSTENYHKIYK